jgi:hypothetical protein
LPCGATGQRRDRSLPRPTWLPDGRSWVNSSSMSELGIVCRKFNSASQICQICLPFGNQRVVTDRSLRLSLLERKKKQGVSFRDLILPASSSPLHPFNPIPAGITQKKCFFVEFSCVTACRLQNTTNCIYVV